jgi:hypothetical protein
LQGSDLVSATKANCPNCGAVLEEGYIMTEQKKNNFLPFYSSSDIYFCREPKMGFFSVPKGEDVTGTKVNGPYLAIPAKRCHGCRLIMFHY